MISLHHGNGVKAEMREYDNDWVREVGQRMPSQKLSIAALFVVCLELAASARVAPPQAPSVGALPDVGKLGPQVGDRVPDFTLVDQQGHPRSLASLMGPQGLMLVFFRSADWCPYCRAQLAELQSRISDLKQNGLGLAAVSYDSVTVLAGFTKRRGITFPLLSDPGSAIIKRYGILNTTVPRSTPQTYGVPFPGTFMVNPQGVVTSRFFEPAYQERTTAGSILVRLGNNVDVPATNVTSPQIEITAFASDAAVAPGAHFSLALDLRPSPGVHVYAPGVKNYIPIALSLQAQPGVVIGKAQFPQPELYHFEPLDEYVQVFQRPFRIVQDVSIDASAAARAASKDPAALTIKGELTYQACDDRICFLPQSVPLAWTIGLKPLDRAPAASP
jgi:peroxiredoxin